MHLGAVTTVGTLCSFEPKELPAWVLIWEWVLVQESQVYYVSAGVYNILLETSTYVIVARFNWGAWDSRLNAPQLFSIGILRERERETERERGGRNRHWSASTVCLSSSSTDMPFLLSLLVSDREGSVLCECTCVQYSPRNIHICNSCKI